MALTKRHFKRIRMFPGKTIANTSASATTYGSASNFTGVVDTQGADLMCITIERTSCTAPTCKNIWRFYTMSARSTLVASATAVTTMTGSSTVNPLSGGGYQYWVDLRGSTFKRFWTGKMSAVTSSTHTVVLADLYALETYPAAGVTGAAGGNGFTTVTEITSLT